MSVRYLSEVPDILYIMICRKQNLSPSVSIYFVDCGKVAYQGLDSHMKRAGGAHHTLRVQKALLVPLMMFSLVQQEHFLVLRVLWYLGY